MTATLVYRVLIAIRACWIIVEWFFDWGAFSRFSSLHPYASLITGAIAVALWLVLLLGMWFFERWAQVIFVLLFAFALIAVPFRVHQFSFPWPPSFLRAIEAFVLLGTCAIIAMSFLPPVRDHFAKGHA